MGFDMKALAIFLFFVFLFEMMGCSTPQHEYDPYRDPELACIVRQEVGEEYVFYQSEGEVLWTPSGLYFYDINTGEQVFLSQEIGEIGIR